MILELPPKFGENGSITCLTPIQINVYYVDRKNKLAAYQWDFGLEGFVNLEDKSLKKTKAKRLKEKILADAMSDIYHAFFHSKTDPNYTSYHWALAGWLHHRVHPQIPLKPTQKNPQNK